MAFHIPRTGVVLWRVFSWHGYLNPVSPKRLLERQSFLQFRKDHFEKLKKSSNYDVLILGGGIDGCAVFRDLSAQGVKCLLLDKKDFVSGASSKSSRMIHGGLRYLENGEFQLVKEAVNERNLLLDKARHYVKPLRTKIPILSFFEGLIKSPLVFLGFPMKPGGRGALIVKLGLSFYEFLIAKKRKTPRHFFLSKKDALKEHPGIRRDIKCMASYWDACMSQVERLCISMLKEGMEFNPNSGVLNYANFSYQSGSIRVVDSVLEDSFDIKIKTVVNATGAWIDRTNHALSLNTKYIGGTKGSHLVINNQKLYDSLNHEMIYFENSEGRVCILYAYEDKVIMGTTDIKIEDPDDEECTEREYEYMLKSLNEVFPDIRIEKKDIVYKYSGVRPLAYSEGEYAGKIKRSHELRVDEPAAGREFSVLSMVGGKLTTFRSFAEEVVQAYLVKYNLTQKRDLSEEYFKGAKKFPESEQDKKDWLKRLVDKTGINYQRCQVLLDRYGVIAEELCRLSQSDEEWQTELKFVPHFTLGEVKWIVANEWVVHLNDFICRRSLLALLGRLNSDAVRELALILQTELNWDESQLETEINKALVIIES